MNMPTLVLDLDDTICFPDHSKTDTFEKYANAAPCWPIIWSIVDAKAKGYRIVISTARRMVTHNGDINKIIEDVGQITEDWLNRYGVPYDELRFGKPYGEYYVDDKAMRPDEFIQWVKA